MRIYVSTYSCMGIGTFEVPGTMRLHDLKAEIAKLRGIPVGEQRLYNGPEELADPLALNACGLPDPAVLILCPRSGDGWI